MSFYDFDTDQIGEELLPPQLRQPRHKAWISVLLTPIQWLRDKFFNLFIGGSVYPDYGPITVYFFGDRMTYIDGGVYEFVNITPNFGGIDPPGPNSQSWYKLQDTFIGVDERLKYNSQIIVYEYALNRWFRNIGATDQIYIVNNATNSDAMLMANTSELSSTMANNSAFANYYMGNTYSPGVQYDYTIMVPAALFATLGATTQDQENAIRNIAEKYNMAGMQYNVLTF